MEIRQVGYNLNQKVLGMCQADVGGSGVGVFYVALMDLTWNCLLLPSNRDPVKLVFFSALAAH